MKAPVGLLSDGTVCVSRWRNLAPTSSTQVSVEDEIRKHRLTDTNQTMISGGHDYDFCKNIKAIRGFQYTQVDNVFSRGGTLFSQVGNIWGQDLPSKVQLKISYGDIPVHGGGRALIDRVYRHREEFEDVIVIGCDDCGIEQTFDFSSVLKHLVIQPTKDENEHFNPTEVRDLLLSNLR